MLTVDVGWKVPVINAPRPPDDSGSGDTPETPLFNDELSPGATLLDGHYRIVSFLNAGRFAVTYRAKDTIDRPVVIKECFPSSVCRRVGGKVLPRSRKHAVEFRRYLRSFIEEAHNQASVVHPGIVGVHQVFEDNGTAYMAIDLVDGCDLLAILGSTDRAFSPAEVVALLRRLLSAVDYIHQIGLLHRDISPDNILIDKAGRPVLIDFGAASQASPDNRIETSRPEVKEGYSPQEHYLAGAEQTAASDLYALGATIYHLISGAPPPPSKRRLAALAEGEADPCAPLAGRFPGYPPGFLAAVDTALRVLPKDRLQSAADWIERLPVEKAETPVTHPSPGNPALVAPERNVSRQALILAGTVALVGGLAAVWALLGR